MSKFAVSIVFTDDQTPLSSVIFSDMFTADLFSLQHVYALNWPIQI